MKTDQDGLASVEDIMALAAQLSGVAGAIHERALLAIRAPAGATSGEAERDAAFALLDEELLLRQHVHALYLDAARAVLKGLGHSQQQVLALTADATEKIRKIGAIADIAGLVAAVVGLAGAAASGVPGTVSLALKDVRERIKAIKAH
ncbi:hypothetical protein HF313_11825 [Massilia atriviolacea]|uniref:Uncharacterized protein n=1 Tax=Massilia atriviolacea TaxID=2495579 RepID=A0A430HIS5_9BURK|nr:hypothetical protein [Massilia atriviolacea]RSZ57418.1 hypothetical protein EJB06_19950 [Massilia atriviolacea]